jgi:hypothetical protein
MRNKTIVITTVLLIIAIGNYFRINTDGYIRSVEFLSIFAIGLLAGVLLVQIFKALFDKPKIEIDKL